MNNQRGIHKLHVAMAALLMIPFLFPTILYATSAGDLESSPQQNIRLNFQRPEVTLERSSISAPQSWFRKTSLTLAADDHTIYRNEITGVHGDITWEMVPDAEILEIGHTGGSYYIEGNYIYFLDVEGYVKVVYRTMSFVTRNACTLIFGFAPRTTEPADWEVSVYYPEFYSDYIESISPADYTQEPGRIFWVRSGITDFPFEASFALGACIDSVQFASGNQTAHHTTRWPDYTFRRVQWVSAEVELQAGFDPDTDSLRWSVKGPSQSDFTEIPAWTSSLPDTSWAVRDGDLVDQTRIDEIFIPAEAAVGLYTLKAASYRDTGEGSIFADSENTPDFYVIFNPWNDDDDPRYDEDVFNPNFNDQELRWYANGGVAKNYYPDGSETVFWLIQPHTDLVFLPTIEEVTGFSSANAALQLLADKAQYYTGDNPRASEVIEGRWGGGSYKPDWRNVPAILKAWDSGNKHPIGQCMDFGGLMIGFSRAIGVPARLLTCVDCGGWNFHVWNEVWTNEVTINEWSPVDATPSPEAGYHGIGPTTRQNAYFQYETATGTALYTHDAASGDMRDILDEYRPPLGLSIQEYRSTQSDQTIMLDVGTDRPTYEFGDTVTILITATNSSISEFSGDLQANVSLVDYSGAHEFYTYPARGVVIPAGSSIVETYWLSRADYGWNGDFLVSATLGTASGEGSFSVEDGLDLQLTTPSEVMVEDSLNVSFRVTNTLASPVSDLDVEIYFPPSAGGIVNPTYLTIPELAAGGVYATEWTVSVSDPGLQPVLAYASSPDAGYDQAHTSFNALGYADLAVLVEVPSSVTPGVAFNATARVRNEGDLTATDVQAVLSLSGELSSTDSVTVSVSGLAAGEEQSVGWSVVALTAGVHALRVRAIETSVGDEELADQLVIAVQEPHDITLTASQRTVVGLDPVTLTLTLENLGDVQDSVRLDIVSNNPNIGFTVYDNGVPLEGSVTVPPQGSHDLSLAIRPQQWENGLITVKAISELDPNAVGYVTIAVREEPFTVSLPIVIKNW